jgi:hypothetical protein
MRITPKVLHKIATDFVNQRTRTTRDLVAVYMHGSALDESPLLGGVTDIDLFFVHAGPVAEAREIVRLTDEVHLDIAHHVQGIYRHPRELRLQPWLGPTIHDALILYDPNHFMDFIQAGVRGQFFYPEHVLQRARQQVEEARQIWMGYQLELPVPSPQQVATYLRAVELAANSIASLHGHPLTERRMLLNFPQCAERVRRPGLYAGLIGLLGGPTVDSETLTAWISAWRATYQELLPEQAPVRLHSHRLLYYLRAFEAILGSARPLDTLWPLVHTWTAAICALPAGTSGFMQWQQSMTHLGLMGERFAERVDALDAYLDLVEETLETWGQEFGA